MNLFKKNIFRISVALNVILLLFSGVVIYQKGGAIYQRTVSVFSNKASVEINLMYDRRVSLFSIIKSPSGGIIFLGDSITQYAEWDELFTNSKVINRGIGSDTTKGVIDRLDQIVLMQPSKIFLMIGINDLGKGVSVQDIESNYEQILIRLKEIKSTKLYVQSLLPVNTTLAENIVSSDKIIELNKRLALLAKKHNAEYVDLYSVFATNGQMPVKYTGDGVHLTGEAYAVWCSQIRQYVND